MIYLDGLNIPENYSLDPLRLFDYAYDNPRRIFNGYKVDYHYQHVGYAEFNTAVMKKQDGKDEIVGLSTHMMGDNIYRMKIEEVISTENSEYLCLCSTLDGDYGQVIVSIEMPDVLPSILPGDIIKVQGVGWLLACSFFDDRESAEKEIGLDVKLMGTQLHLKPGISFVDDKGKGTMQIFTKAHSIKRHTGLPTTMEKDDVGNLYLYCLEVESHIGPLSLVIPKRILPDETYEKLLAGQEQYIIGRYVFSGDAAIDEYNDGAIYDEENLLRLLRHCLDTGDFSRLDRAIADDCRYDGWKKHFDRKEDIIESLKNVQRIQIDEGHRTFHCLGTITEVLMPDVAVYPVGKRCLLEGVVKGKGLRGFCFIELNSDNRIGHICFVYDPVYKFRLDKLEENPNDPSLRKYRKIKTEHTVDEWQEFFLEWASGKEPPRSRLDEIYFGLDSECTLHVNGKEYKGREDIFMALKNLFEDSAFNQREDLKEVINLQVSEKGNIREIHIV